MKVATNHWKLPAHLRRLFWLFVAIGVVTAVAGVALEPKRLWLNWLVGQNYLLSLALGAMFFIAISYVTKAGWHTVVRRVPEAMGATLPVAALLTVPLLFVLPSIYDWAATPAADVAAHTAHVGEAVAHAAPANADTSKATWLSTPFFIVRLVIYFAVWSFLTMLILRESRRQDDDGNVAHTHRNVAHSALFLVAFGVTFSIASFDLIMSLESHWFSTIFGVYCFAGAFLSALAVMTLLVINLRRWGVLPHVKPDHLHNLGKLVFAFSTFWAYIWFSQYMLIWYSNIPEETSYYLTRAGENWELLFLANLAVNWIIPFLVLLPRPAKRNETLLAYVCVLVIGAQWLDRYLMVMPAHNPGGAVFGLLEIGLMIGAVGAFALAFFHAFGRHATMPVNDPYLDESLALHQ